MAKQTAEELIIQRLTITIKKIQKGTAKPSDDENETRSRLQRLKVLNIGMYEELFFKYHKAVSNYRPANVPASRKAAA